MGNCKKEIEQKEKKKAMPRTSYFPDESFFVKFRGTAADPDRVNLPALAKHVAASTVLETLELISVLLTGDNRAFLIADALKRSRISWTP